MDQGKITAFSALRTFFVDVQKGRRSVISVYKRNFFHRYAGAKFNLFWVYLMPCSPIIIYNLLEKLGVFGSHESGVPRSVFVTFGLTLYYIFSESLNITGDAFNSNRNYILKTGLSKASAIMASFLEIISNFVIRTLFMAGITIVFTGGLNLSLFYLPLFGLLMMMISFPFGIFIAIFSVLYKDLNAATGMVGFYLLFASGIFAPIKESGLFFDILRSSPIYRTIEIGREVCLQSGGIYHAEILYLWLFATAFFLYSIVALYRVDPLLDQSI